jgi:hypothetical protein
MGFGQGQGGMGGSGYYLLMILFVELFGVTMGQVRLCATHFSSMF